MAVHIDMQAPAGVLRETLYTGNLLIYTQVASVGELARYMREQLTDLFAPHDPQYAHEFIEPAQMAEILGAWKPRFIHSDRAKSLVRMVIEEIGFDPEETHFDVPKPRTSFPTGHLTTGVAFAFPWHRDVWYSAPKQQINWWLPVFPVQRDNAMSFDQDGFFGAVINNSGDFDYYRNNVSRRTTAQQVKQ